MANKVLFLGSKPIGYHCLEFLLNNREKFNVDIVAIATNNNNTLGKANLNKLVNENAIPVISSLENLLEIDFDYLISVQYHEILKVKHISQAKKLAINLHMAPLPEYRGCNQFSFAIIDEQVEFGTTLHVMDEGIDSGDILFEKRFPISKSIDVNKLYDLTLEKSKSLFEENIEKIFKGTFTRIPQNSLLIKRSTSTHYRKEIQEIKNIDLNWDAKTIEKYVRATSMEGFPPPYAEINGTKINLTIQK